VTADGGADEERADVAELRHRHEPDHQHEPLVGVGGVAQEEYLDEEVEHERHVGDAEEGGDEGVETFPRIAHREQAHAAEDDGQRHERGGHTGAGDEVGRGEGADGVGHQEHGGADEQAELVEGAQAHAREHAVELMLGEHGKQRG
jgi:hypothetical protein